MEEWIDAFGGHLLDEPPASSNPGGAIEFVGRMSLATASTLTSTDVSNAGGQAKAVGLLSRLSSLVQPKEEPEDDAVARAEAEVGHLPHPRFLPSAADRAAPTTPTDETLAWQMSGDETDAWDALAAAERALAVDQAQWHQSAGDL